MRTRTIVRLALLGCGGALAVAIALWGRTLFSGYQKTAAAVSVRVDSLFATGKIDPFAEAYLTKTTPELRATVSKEKWEQIERAVDTHLGRLQSKALTQLNVKQTDACTVVEAAYDAWFEKGHGTISVKYKVVNEQWLLDNLSVGSPLLTDGKSAKDEESARHVQKTNKQK
jgi:hypothetical protein